jgi:hypothetical protein
LEESKRLICILQISDPKSINFTQHLNLILHKNSINRELPGDSVGNDVMYGVDGVHVDSAVEMSDINEDYISRRY